MEWWYIPLAVFSIPLIFLTIVVSLIWVISPQKKKRQKQPTGSRLQWVTGKAMQYWKILGTTIFGIVAGYFLWFHYLPGHLLSSSLFWTCAVILTMVLVARTGSKNWYVIPFVLFAVLLAVPLIVDSGIGKASARLYDNVVERGIGNGDWSEPADHIPTIDGGVLRLKSGESQTVMISGKVRVPNLICHVINASPETEMSWDAGGKNIFLRPFGNLEQQITTITAIPSTESRACREYWRKIRLGR